MALFPQWFPHVRIASELPSGIPGISYRMRGIAHYRSPDNCRGSESRGLHAKVKIAVQNITRSAVQSPFPETNGDAGQRAAAALADWRDAELDGHPGLRIRAQLRLRISREHQRLLAEYHQVRRTAHTDLALLTDRISHLRQHVLCDADTARAWWLTQRSPTEDSWAVFDALILPLVHDQNDPQSDSARIAAVLAEVINRLSTEDEHRMLVRTLQAVLVNMGWPDLAERFQRSPPMDPSDSSPQFT